MKFRVYILFVNVVILSGLISLLTVSCQDSRTESLGLETQHPGVSASEIVIGSSLALGGHAGYLGTQTIQGALAYILHINETGGIHGRKIRLINYDDGYDPPKCLFNTQKLIVEDRAFALFCYVGTPTAVRIIPLVTDAGIPLVGMFTGASRLRSPVNRYLFNIRASYYQEIEAAVDLMVNTRHISRIAVFYQYDEFGFDGLRGTELALKKYNLKPIAKGSYIRGTLDLDDGLNAIADSGAEAVVMIGTYNACAGFIAKTRKSNFSPLLYTVSFVGSEELARLLGDSGEGVIITQVVPPPGTDMPANSLPGVARYSQMLKTYFPESTPNVVGLEGFFNAVVLVEGLKRAGKELTREKFISALETITDFDIGIANALSFSPIDHQGLDKVYFTTIRNGELVLMK